MLSSNETGAPIAKLPNSAQLEGTLPFPKLRYIRVRAVAWGCGQGQTLTTPLCGSGLSFVDQNLVYDQPM